MRAFLAITPDERTLAAIADVQQRCRDAVDASAAHARVSWARSDALHLTVRFFAEIDEALVMTLRDRLAERLSAITSIEVPLARVGGFPRLAAPRVLWIGPPDAWIDSPEGGRLTRIAQAVDLACESLGMPAEDRRWNPHITLARVKDGERAVGNAVRHGGALAPRPTLRADHVTLYKSDPSPGGTRHTGLWTVPFFALPPDRPHAHRD